MDCRAALELVHDDLDGQVGGAHRAEFDAHVASCVECAKAASQLRALRTAIRTLPAVHAPPGFADAVLARTAGAPAAPGGAGVGMRRGRLLRIGLPLAAAAALLVTAVVVLQERVREVAWMTEAAPAARATRSDDFGAPPQLETETVLRARSDARREAAENAAKKDVVADAAVPAGDAPPPASAAPKPSGAKEEKHAGAKAPATAVQQPPALPAAATGPASIVSFRSEAEAQAFVAALTSTKDKAGESKPLADGERVPAPRAAPPASGGAGAAPAAKPAAETALGAAAPPSPQVWTVVRVPRTGWFAEASARGALVQAATPESMALLTWARAGDESLRRSLDDPTRRLLDEARRLAETHPVDSGLAAKERSGTPPAEPSGAPLGGGDGGAGPAAQAGGRAPEPASILLVIVVAGPPAPAPTPTPPAPEHR